MSKSLQICAMALAVGLCAVAPSGSWAGEATPIAYRNDANTVICKRQAAPVGSRIGGARICMTKAQWEQVRRDARAEIEDTQQRSLMLIPRT